MKRAAAPCGLPEEKGAKNFFHVGRSRAEHA